MVEFFELLFTAIFEALTSDPKFNSKYKIWISLTAGVSFFVVLNILLYFNDNPKRTVSIYIELAISLAITLLIFLAICLDEYLIKRNLLTQQKNNDKLK